MSLHLTPHWLKKILKATALGSYFLIVPKAFAQVYGGCGLWCGIKQASGIGGMTQTTSISWFILSFVNFMLNIALLLAVVAIIAAGIYLITSNGDEGQKDKAKKIVTYAVIGIILILFSHVIVSLVNNFFF